MVEMVVTVVIRMVVRGDAFVAELMHDVLTTCSHLLHGVPLAVALRAAELFPKLCIFSLAWCFCHVIVFWYCVFVSYASRFDQDRVHPRHPSHATSVQNNSPLDEKNLESVPAPFFGAPL
jgi:hypothetical protein